MAGARHPLICDLLEARLFPFAREVTHALLFLTDLDEGSTTGRMGRGRIPTAQQVAD